MPRIQEQRLIGPAELKLLADPTREYLVNATVTQARTVAEIAAELGCPPTRLYYHVQRLQKAGLLFVERQRVVQGIVEKHYRAAARVLRLDRTEFGRAQGQRDPRVEAILEHVLARAGDEIRAGVATGCIDLGVRPPDPAALLCYRAVLRLDANEARALSSRLGELYAEAEALSRRAPVAGAETCILTLAFHRTDLASRDPAATPAA